MHLPRRWGHAALALEITVTIFVLTPQARADEPRDAGTPPGDPAPIVPPRPDADADASSAGSALAVSPLASRERAATVEPKAAAPAPPVITFAADPIADGGMILGAGAFAFILELINGTGEIRPQQIAPGFDRSRLLGIDRVALSQTVDPNARTLSNVGLFAAIGFAALDPILTGIRQKHVQAWLVDALVYAEAMTVTWGVTNLAKIAVRRPRPEAYIDAEAHEDDPSYANTRTESALSFFSGHASMTAAVASTATYLAFARSPHTARPWVTLGVGAALTAFVSFERVRGGAHFPTDVIAGSVAGAGIGVIVAHLHRSEDVMQRRVWVGFAPERGAGGVVHVGGVF